MTSNGRGKHLEGARGVGGRSRPRIGDLDRFCDLPISGAYPPRTAAETPLRTMIHVFPFVGQVLHGLIEGEVSCSNHDRSKFLPIFRIKP